MILGLSYPTDAESSSFDQRRQRTSPDYSTQMALSSELPTPGVDLWIQGEAPLRMGISLVQNWSVAFGTEAYPAFDQQSR